MSITAPSEPVKTFIAYYSRKIQMIEHQQIQLEREPGLILLTGATGYVGGRLSHALEQRQQLPL